MILRMPERDSCRLRERQLSESRLTPRKLKTQELPGDVVDDVEAPEGGEHERDDDGDGIRVEGKP